MPQPTGFGWSPDARWLAYTSDDGQVFRVDLRPDAPPTRRVGKLERTAYGAVPSADGRTLTVCGGREAVTLDAQSGRVLNRYPEASYALSIDGGRQLVTAYWDFRIYDAGRVEHGVRALALPRDVYDAAFVDAQGRIKAYSKVRSAAVRMDVHAPGSTSPVTKRQGSDDRDSIRLDYNDKGAYLYDTVARRTLAPRLPITFFNFVAANVDRRTLVVGHDERSCAVYAAARPESVALLRTNGTPTWAGFSPDDRRLVVGDTRGEATFFDAKTWKLLGSVQVSQGRAHGGFSNDGRRFFAGDDQSVTIVDVASRRVLSRLVGNSDAVQAVAFHPDGTRVATGSLDGTVRIWDPRDGRELTLLGRHPAGIVEVGFIDGGRSLVSVDRNGGVRVWLTRREAFTR